MRRSRRLALVGVVMSVLGGAAPASAGTLDQEQPSGPNLLVVGESCPFIGPPCSESLRAQTFTAGITGLLDRVDLVLRLDSGSDPLTIEIRSVAGNGCPSPTVLASQTVGPRGVPTSGSPDWTAIALSNPPSIVAGTRYAIVARTGATTRYVLFGSFTGGNPYGAGQPCHADGSSPTTWQPSSGDFAFKTYVAPLPPPRDYGVPVPRDTNPPETTITKDAPKRTDKSKVKFKFDSSEPSSTFECRLKGKDVKRKLRKFRPCDSPHKYKHLDEGRYRFEVRAIDAAGNVDPTPAKDRFRVLD
jgi:hypothetical protein